MYTMSTQYYTFRLTFVNEAFRPTEPEAIATAIAEVFEPLGITADVEMTMGYHKYNSRGYETTPHFHIHFLQKSKSESAMRKAIQKYCASDPKYMGVVGVKLYSLKNCKEEYIKDIKRFYRYPLKMNHLCEIFFNTYFEDDGTDTCPLAIQTALAIDEYEREKEKILANDKKRDEKSTTYDKFIDYLDSNKIMPGSKYQVQLELVKFYVQEKMSCNPQTMKGYVHTFILQHKLTTIDEWIRENM